MKVRWLGAKPYREWYHRRCTLGNKRIAQYHKVSRVSAQVVERASHPRYQQIWAVDVHLSPGRQLTTDNLLQYHVMKVGSLAGKW